MHFAAIIAEYDPFHNGHAFQIEQTRRAGATHVAVVMSGHITQRADVPCFSKWVRAEAAVRCGADLVIELPAIYACAPAERFAYGAVATLNGLGIGGRLSFGSECGDLGQLSRCVEALEGVDNSEALQSYLKRGFAFPNARTGAIADLFGKETAALLREPNNILAAEYIRALRRTGSLLEPFTVRRTGVSHDSRKVCGRIASASHIREICQQSSVRYAAPFVPDEAYPLYRHEYVMGTAGASFYSLTPVILYHLRTMGREQFAALPDMTEGLDSRFYKASRQAGSMDELLALLKTKRYPMSRMKRMVACAMLGITADTAALPPAYIRVLALNRRGQEILRAAKKAGIFPVYHSFSKLERDFARYARPEFLATELFRLGVPQNSPALSEYRDQRPGYIDTAENTAKG